MTVTRTARLTGAALCGALALVLVVWLLRDLATFGPTPALLQYWAGDHAVRVNGTTATSFVDPLLLVAYVVTAVTALRSPLAGPALAATGLTTLALRLPGLWASGVEPLVTTLLSLGLGTGLVVTAAAGRDGARDGEGPGGAPARPRTGPAVAAGILCAAGGLMWAGMEARWAALLPPEYTVSRFTGSRALLLPSLAVPPGWLDAVLVLLLLAAAGSAFARARHTRPLGLLGGLLLAGCGAAGVAAALRSGRPALVPEPDLYARLYDLAAGYALLAGLAVLVLLARSWQPRRVPYRPAAALPPAPPAHRPPGW
ncbi:hypothetical protein ACFYU9_35785 [Streptomyces sp. NPDC004327]|uniref:hypothetical protein n=1 Tax=unclassified Streptomyces TaxID=2593676 RepID=UPI0036744BAF